MNQNTFVDGMSNDDYHNFANGLSCSKLKSFMRDPATMMWERALPEDRSVKSAVDFGTDFHKYFLEPDDFQKTHRVLPSFNRRKKDEKEAELAMMREWKEKGIVSVEHEDMIKLEAMRLSAMAHPTVAGIMALEGVSERSYFWTDPRTGVRCKARPDRFIDGRIQTLPPFVPSDCDILVADVKTIADIDRVQSQIEILKYYVQDAFYSNGINVVEDAKVCFVFIFVSTSRSLGRYPVQVVMLDEPARVEGRNEIRAGLEKYATMEKSADDSVWQTVVTLDRPSWATREDDEFTF